MFEQARLVGTAERPFILHTKKRTPIENTQAPAPNIDAINKYRRLQRYKISWVNRKPATGIYNCFGHIWANRRTAIYDENQITLIFDDDEYRILSRDDLPMPGDLVIYKHHKFGILHIAEIVEIRSDHNIQIPWALSKWDDCCGEDLHSVHDVPDSLSECELKWWTDRV